MTIRYAPDAEVTLDRSRVRTEGVSDIKMTPKAEYLGVDAGQFLKDIQTIAGSENEHARTRRDLASQIDAARKKGGEAISDEQEKAEIDGAVQSMKDLAANAGAVQLTPAAPNYQTLSAPPMPSDAQPKVQDHPAHAQHRCPEGLRCGG